MGGLTEKQMMMLNNEEPSLDELQEGETEAEQLLKSQIEKKELLKKKEKPWWKEIMKSEIVSSLDPIFHQSYMLMSSYVTDVSIKVELYSNTGKINDVKDKDTKYYGEIAVSLKDIMKNGENLLTSPAFMANRLNSKAL